MECLWGVHQHSIKTFASCTTLPHGAPKTGQRTTTIPKTSRWIPIYLEINDYAAGRMRRADFNRDSAPGAPYAPRVGFAMGAQWSPWPVAVQPLWGPLVFNPRRTPCLPTLVGCLDPPPGSPYSLSDPLGTPMRVGLQGRARDCEDPRVPMRF